MISIQRQKQLIYGILICGGTYMGATSCSCYLWIPAIFGAGLAINGLVGKCGFTKMLRILPFNKNASKEVCDI